MYICPKCGSDNVGCLSYHDPMLYVEELYNGGETTDNVLKGALETFKFRRKRGCRDCGTRFITVECLERYIPAKKTGGRRNG